MNLAEVPFPGGIVCTCAVRSGKGLVAFFRVYKVTDPPRHALGAQ